MLTSLLYDITITLAALMMLPKIIYQRFRIGKYKESMLQRFGIAFPKIDKKDRPLVWVHAVSVGETKAVAPVVRKLKKEFNNPIVIVSSTTETGHAEAKRSAACADYHVYLPLDFRWIIRPIIRRIRPDLIILTETDFWWNFLRSAKKLGTKIVLVNGKLSERSVNRFRFLRFFTKRLFSHIDIFCVQSAHYYNRFLSLGIPQERIVVTGNLKFDDEYPKLPPDELNQWKSELGIQKDDKVIVVGSTHDPEEAVFLDVMEQLWAKYPSLKLVLVPRHPERFETVARLLSERQVPFTRISKTADAKEAKVVLIDAMGLLRRCYQFADIAVVAGSYTNKVGGHNIIEPCWYGVPVLFGPYMHQQPELVELIKQYQAGMQVDVPQIAEQMSSLLKDDASRQEMGARGLELAGASRGATDKTWHVLEREFQKQ
ncbi:MAG: 3-deoxy-D-manno-octulosonic acid transferase [Chlamydiales bacterium]|nr:3-deoxy-D-manno-octulosonic acid transferase [Chlamydiales bacterium]